MSALADAVAAIVGDDHMVQKAQPHVDGQLPHGIGEDEVGTGGPRLAARMVVHQDDAAGL